MYILRIFSNIHNLRKINNEEFFKTLIISDDTLIFTTENTIFTYIYKETNMEILVLDKNEDLVFNIYFHTNDMNTNEYDIVYETTKEILHQL